MALPDDFVNVIYRHVTEPREIIIPNPVPGKLFKREDVNKIITLDLDPLYTKYVPGSSARRSAAVKQHFRIHVRIKRGKQHTVEDTAMLITLARMAAQQLNEDIIQKLQPVAGSSGQRLYVFEPLDITLKAITEKHSDEPDTHAALVLFGDHWAYVEIAMTDMRSITNAVIIHVQITRGRYDLVDNLFFKYYIPRKDEGYHKYSAPPFFRVPGGGHRDTMPKRKWRCVKSPAGMEALKWTFLDEEDILHIMGAAGPSSSSTQWWKEQTPTAAAMATMKCMKCDGCIL